ncbi:MAG: aspartate carbamoyltransferase catalytic subunit [Fusobacterium sp.]|nr:aspartate carbamoyltransferase catalytic subunit [Fusobacterium sp.]
MKNLLKMEDLTNDEILNLIKRALELKNGAENKKNRNIFVVNLFFENSTRTKKSFEIAELKLALNKIDFEVSTSSVQKGETFYDTCKTLEMIGVNILVVRHNQNKYYKELEKLEIPIINAGDGSGEHPSQCLLDLMTIYENFGKFKNLEVIIAGDIKNSRVARSNKGALTRLGAKVSFVAPEIWQDKSLGEFKNLDEVIDKVDVCMLLRVQHERHETEEKNNFLKEEYHKNYGLTEQRYKKLKEDSIIMHPAPVNRNIEIADSLVESKKSKIFEQMKNGMFMRQAILEYIIEKNNL